MAALSRMSVGSHRSVQIEPGDMVVLASSLIPGNENSVYRVINDLTRLGARVVSKENAKVHVSGHASAGELIYCYNIVAPKNVMPIHGEVRHLVGNGQLAVKTGIDPQNVVLAEDGVTVDLKDGVARVSGVVPCEYVYVDGRSSRSSRSLSTIPVWCWRVPRFARSVWPRTTRSLRKFCPT